MHESIRLVTLGLAALCGCVAAQGTVESELADLRGRVDALEKKGGGWAANVKVKGDLRYRHEIIDREHRAERERNRIRARLGVEGQPIDTVKVVLQLASGNDDPVSTNQTLDGGFSTKDIMLDLAYFTWTPEPVEGLAVSGGKVKNPFFKPGDTELIWDGDLNPEGGAVTYATPGDVSAFCNLGGFWVEERSGDADTGLFGAQTGVNVDLMDGALTLTTGLGYFDYANTREWPPIFDPTNSFGNSLENEGDYSEDYDEFEYFAQLGTKVAGVPVAVFGDRVNNIAAEESHQGYLYGLFVGKCKNPGSIAFRYNYRKIERDAVLGVFTDSDSGGGGTNHRGHEIGIDVQLAMNVTAGATYFKDRLDLKDDDQDNYRRFQLDVQFKF